MDLGLDGKCALVLGSSAGLGLAIARELSNEGARVALTGRNSDSLSAAAAGMDGAVAVKADLSDPSCAAELIQEVCALLGRIDVLVLNGGGPPRSTAAGLDPDDLENALQSLLVVQQRLTARVLPEMRAQRWGRIIAVGSSGVQQPLPGMALSNIGRSALAAYLKTLAGEVAADGVTVNMVIPGRIATRRVAELDRTAAKSSGLPVQDIEADSRSRIPAGRYGSVGEFASVVTFLASERASFITGTQVRCDGGMVGTY